MTTLYIERSTSRQTAAVVSDGVLAADAVLGGEGRGGEWAVALENLIAPFSVDAVAVGTGPGSFAGIRGAIAFAQGFAAFSGRKTFGLPSPCAYAAEGRATVAIGDARRGKLWIAMFDGFTPAAPVFQIDAAREACEAFAEERLSSPAFAAADIVSPDHRRIGAFLEDAFRGRYAGGLLPEAAALARAALANPSLLAPDPLPVYLNPAVRP